MTKKSAPDRPEGPFRRLLVELTPDAAEQALGHAQRRNLTLAEFTARLIETALRDQLIEDILGDGEG